MLISESKDFLKIVLENTTYSSAYNEMTTEQTLELNRVLEELIENSEDFNGDYDYQKAYADYKEELENIYIDSEGLEESYIEPEY